VQVCINALNDYFVKVAQVYQEMRGRNGKGKEGRA